MCSPSAGDLIDDYRLIEPTLDALDDPRIPATVAVIGNHEKMGNLAPVINAYRSRKDRISLLLSTAIRQLITRVPARILSESIMRWDSTEAICPPTPSKNG